MTDPDAKLREALDACALYILASPAVSGPIQEEDRRHVIELLDRAALAAPDPELTEAIAVARGLADALNKARLALFMGGLYEAGTDAAIALYHPKLRSPEPPQPLGVETLTTDQAWKAARYLSDLVGKRLAQSNLGDLIAPADVRAALRSPAPEEPR